MASNSYIKKSRGRPPTGRTTVALRLSPEELDALDRAAKDLGLKSRQAVINLAIREDLEARGWLKPKGKGKPK